MLKLQNYYTLTLTKFISLRRESHNSYFHCFVFHIFHTYPFKLTNSVVGVYYFGSGVYMG